MYEVQSGSTKYEVQSTKYGIRVIGCFLLLYSKIEIRNSTFSIPYLVFPTSYIVLSTLYNPFFLLCTWYLVLCTIPHFYLVLSTWYLVHSTIHFPNSILTELMQYRVPPLSDGPSGKR